MKRFLIYTVALLGTITFFSIIHAEDSFVYQSHGRRDPFVPLVGASATVTDSLEDVMSIDDIRLQGLATDSSGKRAAILNGEMIKKGQTIGRVTVKEILEEKIVIMIDEDRYEIDIFEKEK